MIAEAMSVVRRPLRPWVRVVALVVLAVSLGLGAGTVAAARESHHASAYPQSAAMEDQLGVRFSRLAVVGDGGLITLTYVVLDAEKATRFQSDIAHPPELLSEDRSGGTKRVSLMKQGHSLRAGQTYYLVYENTRGALRHGGQATIVYGQLLLRHAPVL